MTEITVLYMIKFYSQGHWWTESTYPNLQEAKEKLSSIISYEPNSQLKIVKWYNILEDVEDFDSIPKELTQRIITV